MKKIIYIPFILILWVIISSLYSCGEIAPIQEVRLLDSLNQKAYNYRYKNLDTVYQAALKAYTEANLYKTGKAEAANHLGFYAFMHMDFDGAENYYREVLATTPNELECLIADVGLMKIYQRTSMNKEFFDYRNSALNRISRIQEDISIFVDFHEKQRVNYALSEFHIVSAIYYYYLQQKSEAIDEINQVQVNDVLLNDTAQWLYYQYIKGSAGLCESESREEQVLCEFDNLYRCWMQSGKGGYIYFEGNSLQGLAELLTVGNASVILKDRRSQALRTLNKGDDPDASLAFHLAQQALQKFKQYDDIYQIAGAYRTLGTWLNEQGLYTEALDSLQKSLDQVNRHHELYYACLDTLDRLKPYCPVDTMYIELDWINRDEIKTVPEWIARIREQLAVAYAGLDWKEASDYNWNIYLDILKYTRQDKELVSRFEALEKESRELNFLILVVILGIILLIPLFWLFNRKWEKRNQKDIYRLKKTLEICQKITSSLPLDAKESSELVSSVIDSILPDLKSLFPIHSLQVSIWNDEEKELEKVFFSSDEKEGRAVAKSKQIEFQLSVPDKKEPIGILYINSFKTLTKDDISLLKVIAPYIAWVIENGLTFITLGDERRRLEKELYVHEQHIIENKRQNLIKRSCMAIVVGVNPFIDRIINEIDKLRGKRYTQDEEVRREKFQYIDELITKINEYNDILALWIKVKQGTLSLNIENFELNDLFNIIGKGRKTFEMKQQTLDVKPVNVIVKADKALTLFMLNTLTENARKYTPKGGSIAVYAQEEENYVEISVADNGRGLTKEDISKILDEKIYDSSQIGIHSSTDLEELRKNKGSGFGLMNCKGIIEKYRKTSDLFRVCLFGIESTPGKGSRFFFRLPKGVRKVLGICLLMVFSGLYASCENQKVEDQVYVESEEIKNEDKEEFYRLLDEASNFADTAYYCNVIGEYEFAIQYIDSTIGKLNEHYYRFASDPFEPIKLFSDLPPAEVIWWNDGFDSDFHIILDIRNEAAVAFLALKEWDAYRYNSRAFTTLYKILGEDVSLAEYCRRLENSTNNKIVGIILCGLLVLILLIGYYIYYVRRRFLNRRNLEEVLDVNREIFAASLVRSSDMENNLLIPERIVNEIFDSVNELLLIDGLAIAVYNEDTHKLEFAFNPTEFEGQEELQLMMRKSFGGEDYKTSLDSTIQCFPLWINLNDETHCIGVLGWVKQLDAEKESDRILSEMIARFVSIVIYNAVVRLSSKYRDIEAVKDETNRASREEGIIHVQNMVLDNCLSTIKHETIYYPNKIKQIIDKLVGISSSKDEQESIETIHELVSYYKDIYTILSSCASRQLEEVTFRRNSIEVKELEDYAQKYFLKMNKRFKRNVQLLIDFSLDATIVGDMVLLRLLLENLINEALNYPQEGNLELSARLDGEFVRFTFADRRREKSVEELNHLFYPDISKMRMTDDGRLIGVEYLICKQVIRDHDEYAGRRGCRMNAEPDPDGGFMVYFTIPRK